MSKHAIVEMIPQKNQDDYISIMPAYLSIWNHPDNHRFLSFTLQPFTEELSGYWFRNHLNLGGRYFAATDENNSILGLSVLKISQIECFELFGLGVRPEYKRRGIGGSLVGHAIDLASTLGYKAVDAGVMADNASMMRLLLSFNFMPVRINHHARADGADLVIMKKYLQETNPMR